MSQIVANGITLDIEEFGDPDAPPLLLIMGLGMPGVAWPIAFVERLVAAGLRVIRFDNRDCGYSTQLTGPDRPNLPWAFARALLRLPVSAPYTLDDMAQDAADLLSALGIERAHVAGASMGGMIAQVLATRHPQRVLTLTSIMSTTGNPSPRVAFGKPRALRAAIERPRRLDDPEAMVRHLMRVFGIIGSPGYPSSPEALRAQLEPVAQRGYHPAGTARQVLAILASGDRRAQLAHIAAPTLVIHGFDDPLLPLAAGIDTARHIRGAQLRAYPGMGHDFAPGLQPLLAAAIVEHIRQSAHAPAPV